MPNKLILDNAVVANDWVQIAADHSVEAGFPSGNLLLPLDLWNKRHEITADLSGDIGLWLASDQLPEMIEGELSEIPVIAVELAPFADGRGFSIGRLLRERFNYQGELRAIGAPLRDQLTFLKRCGFNAFELAEHYDAEDALNSLNDFSFGYQTSVDQVQPLFKIKQN